MTFDPRKLATLGGSQLFTKLDPAQQEQLLVAYGAQPKGTAAREVDKIAADPANKDRNRLTLLATPGFFKLNDNEQKFVLDRYSHDTQFRGAIDDRASKIAGVKEIDLEEYAGSTD